MPRWNPGGEQTWEDEVGRVWGKAQFVGPDNVRVHCYCHTNDMSLLRHPNSSMACGGMLYCNKIWHHVNALLNWYFAMGTTYCGGTLESLNEQKMHHEGSLKHAQDKLRELRSLGA